MALMGELGARESREIAEEEKRRLIDFYMKEDFTPKQLLAGFKVESLNVMIKEGAVPCRYSYGKNERFNCPGVDQDCLGIEGGEQK